MQMLRAVIANVVRSSLEDRVHSYWAEFRLPRLPPPLPGSSLRPPGGPGSSRAAEADANANANASVWASASARTAHCSNSAVFAGACCDRGIGWR